MNTLNPYHWINHPIVAIEQDPITYTTMNPPNISSAELAADFAALVKKHDLVDARLYYDMENAAQDHLVLQNGEIYSYHEPKPVWTKITSI